MNVTLKSLAAICLLFLISAKAIISASASELTSELSKALPSFLTQYNYATNSDICVSMAEGNDLLLNETGIWGNEFSCTFVGFDAERDVDTGELTDLYQARVNCTDDSGIFRPDLITMIFDSQAQKVNLQSQNEFVLGEALRLSAKPDEASASETKPVNFVSREYLLCETN